MARFFDSLRAFATGRLGEDGSETAMVHLTPEEQAARRAVEAREVAARKENTGGETQKVEKPPENPELKARREKEAGIKGAMNASNTSEFWRALSQMGDSISLLTKEEVKALEFKRSCLPDFLDTVALPTSEVKERMRVGDILDGILLRK